MFGAAPPNVGTRINGAYYDFSSIEAVLGTIGVCINLADINYSQKLDPGVFRGTGAKVRGRTRGTYTAEGNLTIYKEDYERLKFSLAAKSLGQGYMTAAFIIVVTYRSYGAFVPVVDTLRGCRITSEDNNHSQGNNALVVKLNLSIMEILANNLQAVADGPGDVVPSMPGL